MSDDDETPTNKLSDLMSTSLLNNISSGNFDNSIDDYSSYINWPSYPSYNYGTSTTTTTTGPVTGTVSTGSVHTGLTHSYGSHTHTIGNHNHNIYGPTDYQFYKQPFSKSAFLKHVIIDGNDVGSFIDRNIDMYTDDGIIDCVEMCDQFELLTHDIFWYVVNKNIVLYALHPEFHTIEKCVEIIAKSKNKNIIQYTHESVRNDIEFKRRVNKLKLKGEL